MMIWDIYPADSERGDSLCEVSKRLSSETKGAVKKEQELLNIRTSYLYQHLLLQATCDNAKMAEAVGRDLSGLPDTTTLNFAAMMIWDIYPADSERGDSLCEVSKRLSSETKGAVKKEQELLNIRTSYLYQHLLLQATCDNAKM